MTVTHTPAPTITLNNGIEMPSIGLGLFKVEDGALADIIGAALSADVRMFDTAPMYGNERALGNALRASMVSRGEVFVITKISNDDHGYARALSAFEASLARLGTDYVDQVLIHWPLPGRGLYIDTWRALVDVAASGRARSIGVCNFDVDQIDALINATSIVPSINQVELHPLLQQRNLLQRMGELGTVVQAWAPLARGQVLEHPVVVRLARFHQVTPAQIVLRWHVQTGVVPIPKSSRLERIAANADVFHFRLSESDMQAMSTLNVGHRTGPSSDVIR
ncbi:aldo/keto reductase [Rhodococcoides fascians]|uniref:aldo/keto reductase n=1 Tax=Rhodococcoides fascians TaxID=1828 RepID=UPI00050CC353|nr:aldo/keto reductase [Rhodococcus fascians]